MFDKSVFAELLRKRLEGVVALTDAEVGALQAHYELLLKWNQTLNLTRVDNLEEAVERHYAEGLFLASRLPKEAPLRIGDIGSGAGFPGFPVAVALPGCSITLIESHQRKAVFLREASRKLPNVQVLAQRAEEVKERFDIAISRAVSYEDLRKPLKKLANRALLLTGVEEPPDRLGFEWSPGVVLPWGNQRFLRVGVSRETVLP